MGKKYRFVTYRRLKESIFTPALLIAIVSLLLAFLPNPPLRSSRWLWGVIAGASLLLCLWLVIIERAAGVQVSERGIRVSSLLGSIEIPYDEIEDVSLSIFGKVFDPAEQSFSQRIFLHPLWFETVLVLKLKKFPYSYGSLRALFGKYLFEPRKNVVALAVEDWQELNVHISGAIEEKRPIPRKPA